MELPAVIKCFGVFKLEMSNNLNAFYDTFISYIKNIPQFYESSCHAIENIIFKRATITKHLKDQPSYVYAIYFDFSQNCESTSMTNAISKYTSKRMLMAVNCVVTDRSTMLKRLISTSFLEKIVKYLIYIAFAFKMV